VDNFDTHQRDKTSRSTETPGGDLLLELQLLTKRFPGVTALDAVDFNLYAGEVHVLFGENGSGKSTLVNVIAGTYPRDGGGFRYLGRDIPAWNPQQARAAGISPVFQEFSLAPDLTVEENLFLGRERHLAGILSKRQMHEQGRALFAELGFQVDQSLRVRYLSRADQQMTEIAKALLQEVRILILDEPTASLTERETVRLYKLIEGLKSKGVGIIYVSHRMAEIRLLGDRITILRDGQKIGTVASEEVTDDELVEMMTGRKIGMLFPKIDHRPGRTVLAVEDLASDDRLSDVNLYIREGEIIGIAGLAGSCKSNLLRAVFGLLQPDGGKIVHKGETVDSPRPLGMLKRGVIYLPSDRSAEGVALPRPVRENASIAALDMPAFSVKGLLRLRGERRKVDQAARQLQIRPTNTDISIQYLSGGNQQKVMLLRGLIRGADVFLLDDPTVGIDVGAKKEVYNFLKELVEQKRAAVLFVSSELPELLNLCNRLYVARNDRLAAEFSGEDITEENVFKVFFKVDGPSFDGAGDGASKESND
jgi:ribose transport system ATP-binding protein